MAYAALATLTLLWGSNWIAMKFALAHSTPVTFNAQRIWLCAIAVFAVLIAQRRTLWPEDWTAVLVTGFFQTLVNFGATTMALANGGVGRTAVLVFTMPFWTLLIAWPVLHERVRGTQWVAVACALAGMLLLVEPWNWRGDLAAKLWAVLSGFGWAAGTVSTKYFQRRRPLEPLTFLAWQMALAIVPFTALAWLLPGESTQWSPAQAAALLYAGPLATAGGFLLWLLTLRYLPAGTASLNMFAVPVIALLSSMAVYGESLSRSEWAGIAAIGAGLAIITVRALLGRAEAPLRDATPLEGG